MDINRRNLITGTVAAVIATQIPSNVEAAVEAIKPVIPLDQSLLFHKNTGNIGFMMRSKPIMLPDSFYESNTDKETRQKEIAFVIDKYTSDTTFKFKNADDLDQYYFGNCNICQVDYTLNEKNTKTNFFHVERVCNQIAKDTKIGRGNSIVLSQRNANYFSEFVDHDNGLLLGSIRVFVRSWVEDNEILVFYRNYKHNFDIPGLVFDDGGIALNNDFKYAQKLVFKI